MRFRRGGAPASPTDGLDFEIAVPEGLEVRHGLGGYDLTISTGDPGDDETILKLQTELVARLR